jgi:hypothetical protein
VVAHFPVAENIGLHLVKGQEPMADTTMRRGVCLRIGDRMMLLGDVLERYCTPPPVAQFAFNNDQAERLPMTIGIPDGVEVVMPSGEARFLDRIELEVVFDRERSNEKFDRKIYGDAGLSFASRTYTRGGETACFTFSMLQHGDEQSAAAAVRTSDAKPGFTVTPKMKSPMPPSGQQQSH